MTYTGICNTGKQKTYGTAHTETEDRPAGDQGIFLRERGDADRPGTAGAIGHARTEAEESPAFAHPSKSTHSAGAPARPALPAR